MPRPNPALTSARRWTAGTMAAATLVAGAVVVELDRSASTASTATTSGGATSSSGTTSTDTDTAAQVAVAAVQGAAHASTSGS